MIKWFFTLTIAFISIWIIFKDFYPDILMETEIADSLNAIGYPIEKNLLKSAKNIEIDLKLQNKKKKKLYQEISGDQLASLLKKVNNSNKNAVILFYKLISN